VNVFDAAYKTVHEYAGGSESLGPRLEMSPAVLRSKVNPNNATHHLTLAEADELMAITDDHRILQALAAAHGYTLLRTDPVEDDGSLMTSILDFQVASGDISKALNEAVTRGLITKNASKDIAACGANVQKALITMVARAASLASARGKVA